MEPITEPGIDLFADNLLSMDEIQSLSEFIHSGEANMISFNEQVESNMSKTGQKANLSNGIGLFILGRDDEAAQKLAKAKDCMEKYMYLAFALRRLGQYDKAIGNLQKSLDFEADKINVAMETTAIYRCAGDFEAAAKILKGCANFENVSAEYHYQKGKLQDCLGNYGQAMNEYELAIDLDHGHVKSLFALAYSFDLRGDEQEAAYYYKELVQVAPAHVNGLLNLAVLYEDMAKYDKALHCVESVLRSHPNHAKARLFKKDILSASEMVYDEEKEKRQDRQNKILEIPISDFELSVRSRNCLKKMNIHTVGDLLRTSESELLSYKNFGETSLQEIKGILSSKGLRLGMITPDTDELPKFLEPVKTTTSSNDSILNKPLEELDLSVRSRNCLTFLQIKTLGQLADTTEQQLLSCKNFGQTSLNEIRKKLADYGLSLKV